VSEGSENPRDETPPAVGESAASGIALALLMLTAATQYAWNAVAIPALAGYDAGPHVGYILAIVETGRLPELYSGTLTFHPPLYYLLGSGVWALLDPVGPDAISAGLRAIGGVATLLAGVVTWRLVRERSAWPVAWTATALVLFVPAAQMSAAMVGNEALAAGLAALALPSILALQRDPRRVGHAVAAGLFAGLAFATKFSGLFVVAACMVPFLRRDFDRGMLRALAAGLVVGAIVAGPVYARNWWLAGSPFPFTRVEEPLKSMEAANVLRPRRVSDYLWLDPACLLRPSIHHAPGVSRAARRRNPDMTNVWGLAYASIWYDAQGHRIPLAFHRDGNRTGPLLTLLGIVPTGVMLFGFVLALVETVRRRGRADDAPLVALWCTGIAFFVAFTWWAQSVVAVKGSYLLPLSVPGALFFASGVNRLGARARPWILAVSAAAAIAAAVVFTQDLVYPAAPAERMAHRYRMMGELLPDSYIKEAADRLVLDREARPRPRPRH
jgi:4-amino-4-deoxy-L-arabinose transferase-like glycosyltransferase